MSNFRLSDFLSFSLFSLSILIFQIVAPELGFKSLAFAVFSIATLIIILIPIKLGIMFTFLYIGLEGSLKVISSYHPVIHVGADVLVLFLTLRIFFEAFAGLKKEVLFTPPLAILFLFHFIWIFITMFNPYSLGFTPSIAGAKVYITMVLLYFFGYSQTRSLKDVDDYLKPFMIVVVLHTVFGIYQGLVGENSVIALHPGYAAQLQRFKDTAFRPFGLTNLPGGPAVYLSFMFPIALYVIFTFQSVWMRLLAVLFLPAGVFLFLLCQVRASFIKMMIGCSLFFFGFLFSAQRQAKQIRFAVLFLALLTISMVVFLPRFLEYYTQQDEKNFMAVERSLTVFDFEKLSRARFGVLPRFVTYLETAPLGAGFSRIGGASVKFLEERKQDEFFKVDYFFADNFWLACLIEIGLPGMILLTVIMGVLWFKSLYVVRSLQDQKGKLLALSLFSSITAMLIGLYGSEGILYNPDACFYWFFSGVLMKLPEICE